MSEFNNASFPTAFDNQRPISPAPRCQAGEGILADSLSIKTFAFRITTNIESYSTVFVTRVVSAIKALDTVNTAIIQPMVHGVPSLSKASSREEIMPLPY